METLPKEMWMVIFGFVRKRGDWFNVMIACKEFLEMGRRVFDPSFNDSISLCFAYANGMKTAVSSLLSDTRINPMGWDCECLIQAANESDYETVEGILKHPKTDATAVFLRACATGIIDLLKRVVKDPRVTDQIKINMCIQLGLAGERMDIARELATHLGIYNPECPRPFTVTIQQYKGTTSVRKEINFDSQ